MSTITDSHCHCVSRHFLSYPVVKNQLFSSPPTSLVVSVPDVPEAAQAVVVESDTFYHMVKTERGAYRSATLNGKLDIIFRIYGITVSSI